MSRIIYSCLHIPAAKLPEIAQALQFLGIWFIWDTELWVPAPNQVVHLSCTWILKLTLSPDRLPYP